MRNFGMTVMMTAAAGLALGGCADTASDDEASDGEAEAAPPTSDADAGKADAPTFVGVYATATTTVLAEGDVPHLQLITGGTYVRERCYHAACAITAPETDHYDTYTSSSGKTYLRFYASRSRWNATHDDRDQLRVTADVYEIKKTSTTIKLRKSYSSRWVTLKKTTPTALCNAGDGDWESGTCSCPGATGWSDDSYIGFIPGLGGCVSIPGVGEGECDDTEGWYTDDDGTRIGTYCLCDHGAYLTTDGCTAL